MRFKQKFRTKELENEKFDLIIIGSGLAGLSTAYYFTEQNKNKNVCVLSKGLIEERSSFLAQGGIASAIDEKDSAELHFKDTINAGAGINNREAVKVLVNEGIDRVKELIELGLEFDLNDDGIFSLGREGLHSKNRILHINGDATGKGLSSFYFKLCQENNVSFIGKTEMKEILGKDSVNGVLSLSEGELKVFSSSKVVLATGGYSSLYLNSTNPLGSIGSGLMPALRIGAELTGLEFEQFHPTVFFDGNESFLVSEAVRGEGAKIVDENRKNLVEEIKGKELAGRDILSRKLFELTSIGKKVFLDCSIKDAKYWKKRFPTVFSKLKKSNITMGTDLVQISPAAHYSIGGIKTGLNGETSIPGLFAVGESSNNGVHGANRLASNSLLECIVFGKRTALKAIEKHESFSNFNFEGKFMVKKTKLNDFQNARKIMWNNVGIKRDNNKLNKAINFFETKLKKSNNDLFELGLLTSKQALIRKNSIGCHFRTDSL